MVGLAKLASPELAKKWSFFLNSWHCFQTAYCHLFSILMISKPQFFLQKTREECSQEAVEHLKEAGKEPEPSAGESI